MVKTLNVREEKALRYLLTNDINNFNAMMCKDVDINIYNTLVDIIIAKGYAQMKNNVLLCTSRFVNEYINVNLDWIDEYRKLFAVQLNRISNKEDVKKEMREFLKANIEFDKDIVIKAAKLYIDEKAKDNYLYVLSSLNFIKKGNLKEYCELIKFKEDNKQNIGEEDGKQNDFSGNLSWVS